MSNLSVIESFTPKGRKEFLAKWKYFENAYETVEQDSGVILTDNLQDRSFRAGLNLAGYKPIRDPEAMAIEWLQMDFEYAQKPVRYITVPDQGETGDRKRQAHLLML